MIIDIHGHYHRAGEAARVPRQAARRACRSQAGFLDHEETVKGMTLFAREVYPRLKELPESG
jgi:hypothetical protein